MCVCEGLRDCISGQYEKMINRSQLKFGRTHDNVGAEAMIYKMQTGKSYIIIIIAAMPFGIRTHSVFVP